jgi:hypothetical protein
MNLPLENTLYTGEDHNNTWVVVPETSHHDGTQSKTEQGSVSSINKHATNIDGRSLSDIARDPTHTNSHHPTLGVVLHTIASSNAHPTPEPRVQSVESEATGLTFGAPEDVSSNTQPRTPAEDNSLRQPLTWANLRLNNMPGLSRDIQAWVNGDLKWLRAPPSCDKASDVPLLRGATCHGRSLDFVFVPAQAWSFELDALAIGARFEGNMPTPTSGSGMELEEDWMCPGQGH